MLSRVFTPTASQAQDGVERNIWIYWNSGESSAPELVRLAVSSWRILNPTWKVYLVSDTNLFDFVGEDELGPQHAHLPIQQASNIIRGALLRKHGGVWVDATLLCLRPLDSWLPQKFAGDFLAPQVGRSIFFANWFLVSKRHGVFITAWQKSTLDYFSRRRWDMRILGQRIYKALVGSVNTDSPESTLIWTNQVVKSFWPFYPYKIHHYLANRLVLRHPLFRTLTWREHSILGFHHGFGLNVGRVSAENVCAVFENLLVERAYFVKLNWRVKKYQAGVQPQLKVLIKKYLREISDSYST